MRWGLGICGLMIHTSGHNHGSRRYIDAMPQSVSPRLTVECLGALGLTMPRVSAGGAAGAAAVAPAALMAASVAVICGSAGTARASARAAGTRGGAGGAS